MTNETRLHKKKSVPDPQSDTWVRHDFSGGLKIDKEKESRQYAELETDRDLEKPIQQLLCDFHEQAIKKPKGNNLDESILDITLHAHKRMVSMMAKVAISNNRMSYAMFAVSVSALICAVVALFK